jgi:hypothetical protein
MLSEHQIDKYVARDGKYCPYCDKHHLQSEETVWWGDATGDVKMTCLSCHKQWVEVYRLSDIKEINE